MSIESDKLMNLADGQVLYNDLRQRTDARADLSVIAPDYADLTFPVAERSLCTHEGSLYKANQTIATSETWTAAHWTETTVSDEIDQMIDDTAGAGDTDKTFSADKLTEELGDLKSAINDKQDAPSTAGTAGQVLSLDSNLDPVWTTPQSGGAVDDVQIDGTSIVNNGVANIPHGSNSTYGAVKGNLNYGVSVSGGEARINSSNTELSKPGTNNYRPIVPASQHAAAFYGLAKAAGDATQSASSNAVGTYTEDAKSAISEMLNGAVSVSGTTPSITAMPGV